MKKYNLDYSENSPTKIFKKNQALKNLTIGDRLIIKHYSMMDYSNSYILDISNDIVKLTLKSAMLELDFSENDPITLSFNSENKFFIGAAEIISIDSVEPLIMNVKLVSVQKKDSIRKNERFYVSLSSLIKGSSLTVPTFAVVKNLSLNGFKINSRAEIDIGDEIDITVSIDNFYNISCKSTIVRKMDLKGQFEYGLQIKDITQTNLITFNHYINQLKNGI